MTQDQPAPGSVVSPAAATNPHGASGSQPAPQYAELHAHTNFSLLDGTSDPEAMVTQAAALVEHSGGLIALSACAYAEVLGGPLEGRHQAAVGDAAPYGPVLRSAVFSVEPCRHHLQSDGPRNAGLTEVARALGLRCVATN